MPRPTNKKELLELAEINFISFNDKWKCYN